MTFRMEPVVLRGDDYLALIKQAIAENLAARIDHDKRKECERASEPIA